MVIFEIFVIKTNEIKSDEQFSINTGYLLELVKRSRHAIGLVTKPCKPGQYRCGRSTSEPECPFNCPL